MTTTYVTLSTPAGEGGIHIIELVGSKVKHIISQIFKPKRSSSFVTLSGAKSLRDSSSRQVETQNDIFGKIGRLKPQRLYLGHVYDQDRPVDEVIINYIPSQESFTGLDTIEINSHGGMVPAKKIMTLLQKRGARKITSSKLHQLALKRKRLDTIQAEALEALQSAPTPLATQVLLDQYNGALSREVGQILSRFSTKQPILLNKLRKLLTLARLGLVLTVPRKIVIGGPSNVGKSTLFNALVGQEKVIVHHLPGTTRDVVEELISIDGIPFSLRDTAGLLVPDSVQGLPVKEGIKKAKRQIRTADLIIFLLDGSQPLPREMNQAMKLLNKWPADRSWSDESVRRSPILYVLNKNDLPRRLTPKSFGMGLSALGVDSAISISALHQRGLEKLRQSILETLQLTPALYKPGQPMVFTQRQFDLLNQTYNIIKQNKTSKSLSRARRTLERII